MKTSFKKLFAPLAVAIVGALGAFATTSMAGAETPVVDQQGYYFVSTADPCHADLMCTTDAGDACTTLVGNTQLWGKANEQINICDVRLNRKPN